MVITRKYGISQTIVLISELIIFEIAQMLFPNGPGPKRIIEDMITPDRYIFSGLMYIIFFGFCLNLLIAGFWVRSKYKRYYSMDTQVERTM